MCVKQKNAFLFLSSLFFFFIVGSFFSLSLFSVFARSLSLPLSPPPLSSLFSLLSSSLMPEPDGRGVQGPGTN